LKGLIFPLVIFGGGSLLLERYLVRVPPPNPNQTKREVAA
jgi:hypothetical protein